MCKSLFVFACVMLTALAVSAQDKKAPPKDKKTLLEKVSEIPDALVAQKEKVDTNTGRFIQDVLSIEVPPIWKEKGQMLFNDLKLVKADKDPIVGTLPLPEKKIVQGVNITLNTIKKTVAEKKAVTVASVKAHLAALNKEIGKTMTVAEMDEQVNSMITGPEAFVTAQGRGGELYLLHDLQPQQLSYNILLLVPSEAPGMLHFAQFQYYRFNYETSPPDDIMDWKTFVYPDEQQTYVDFTKKILRTLVIK